MLAQKFQALTDAAKKAGKGPKPAAPAPAAAAPAPAASTGSGPAGFKSTAVFEKIAANLKSDPTLTKKLKGTAPAPVYPSMKQIRHDAGVTGGSRHMSS